MTPSNRQVTSREYKLLLNSEGFRARSEGTETCWNLLAFLAEQQGIKAISKEYEVMQYVGKLKLAGTKLKAALINYLLLYKTARPGWRRLGPLRQRWLSRVLNILSVTSTISSAATIYNRATSEDEDKP